MKIKDIVNRDLVNLTNCESEPIHIPGSIQPHGFLLAVTEADQEIKYCSGNIASYSAYTYEQVLGKKYETVFGAEESEKLKQYILTLESRYASPLSAVIDGKEFFASVHRSGELYMVEFEPNDGSIKDISTIYNQTRQFVSYMEHATSLQMLCQAVADETRAITGYDRVMVYRFDKDYNGEVFAESKTDAVEPFLGLHYPHTDIPPQARELYRKNLIRVIADVNYVPVPIYTLEDKTNSDLDLSYSVLRSVSPIHVQYLHNIGVGASLSISLMHEGKLWGLIACHHYGPKPVDSYTRIAAQLQGHFMTSQINVREIAEEYVISTQVNSALDKILAVRFALDRESFQRIAEQKEILELCNATGVAILVEGVLYKSGQTPDDEGIMKVINWCRVDSVKGYLSSHHLSSRYEEAVSICETSSGIYYQSLDLLQQNCIVWFRQQTIREINWGGDPEKAIVKDKDQLSPRKSFALWKENVKCQSKEWRKPELAAAANFANALQKHIHTLFISEEESRYRNLNFKLTQAYAELENLNWVTSHDLKEPLRKIQLFASKIMATEMIELPESAISSLQKIQNSAARMQKLINDVLSYARIKQFDEPMERVDLSVVLDSALAEINDELADKGASVVYDKLPEVLGTGFLIAQLFSNLMHNSLKFARQDEPARIEVRYHGVLKYSPQEDITPRMYHQITFADNGIGFDNSFRTSIFKVFTRLHHQSEYSGTGIGLALSKKIIESHGGFITADGVAGEGASFTLYFPVIPGED